ncbi:hypothetical protein DL766_004330 [Monosporascus sp. MC13-8B]|uniref:Mtf2-like C-terminal domain-containing protein n=1 Tax=Monosporascus cannonballus TaxID=155416 RepID=A0ABY0H9P4_9PEZI|nr:hypothetical protein DL762_003733 [Monosporascus cannonballus]RYO98457.1 hypothetical protein DL763_002193 [Monosporascus cannonballus]RYP31554.1 hypothetical protein DL766_004330 [Monosporascus sp. MC13-8B]
MPSTSFLPFLYQTRTILKSPRVPVAFLRSLHATSRYCKGNDIPFVYELGEEDVPLKSVKRGTITPSERQIFERIFADIQARALKPSVEEGAPPSSSVSASRSAMLIMQQAAQDAGQARPDTVTAPALLAGAAKDRNKALLRFPPQLRDAASRALDAIVPSARGEDHERAASADVDDGWKAPPHTFMRKFELDAKRFPERMRVEGLITSAKTDHELWDVLEKEVFTMPAKLGLGRKADEEERTATKPARERKKERLEAAASSEDESRSVDAELEAEPEGVTSDTASATTVETTPETTPGTTSEATRETASMVGESEDAEGPVPPEKMSLYIHGPLYPAYLLLALRQLNTAFHTSSPLALNVLPRVKELGLESYVLGVSTPFYNELLDIYWSRYGDLSGMLDLVEEMRHCGLYFDGQTSSILGRAQAAVRNLAEGRRYGSSFGAAIMTMPQYEKSVRDRIRHWHQAVDISIQQRGYDIGY